VRYCPNCGTEVDETAVFCPTCGQPVDQAAETEMPAAPAWPDASDPSDEAPAAAVSRAGTPPPERGAAATGADRTEHRPQTPPPGAPPPPASASAASAGPSVNVPLTMPVTLSGWLIGVGALIGGLGIVVGLIDDGFLNVIDLVLLLALIAISVAIFFSASLARFPNLRLATLVVALIGFGVALDRIGFSGAGVGELLLFLGTAAAAIGGIILELGRDQPLGPSR
jgi:zinc-ribbon domain